MLIVDYLSQKHGFDKVLELLRGYGEDKSTEQLFGDVFGLSTAEFDRRFLEHVERVELAGMKLVPRFSERRVASLQAQIMEAVAQGVAPSDAGLLEARVNLGWAFAQRGNTIDAAAQLRLVLDPAPRHPRGLLLHAELLLRREATDEAIAAYKTAFGLGAEDFGSRVLYGQTLAERGDVDAAIEQFQRAKACWPRCTDQQASPHLLLARLLRANGRDTEAMMEVKAFVQRTGRAFEPRLELAAAEKDAGNRREELQLLEEARAIDPFMRSLHDRLGDAYEATGRVEEALRSWRTGLEVRPDLDRSYLGKSPAEVPDPDSVDEREARAELCLKLAKGHHALGQREEAARWLSRVERESPGGKSAGLVDELRKKWQ